MTAECVDVALRDGVARGVAELVFGVGVLWVVRVGRGLAWCVVGARWVNVAEIRDGRLLGDEAVTWLDVASPLPDAAALVSALGVRDAEQADTTTAVHMPTPATAKEVDKVRTTDMQPV